MTSPLPTPPGYSLGRLTRLMRSAVDDCRLDLSGAVVVTEGATGAYVVTPVLAALAGAARVTAVTRTTRHGTAEDVAATTMALAAEVGVASRVTVTTERRPELIADADVVTNSGHLRPIDAAMAAAMKPTAVVPLMFEAWELLDGRRDIDLDALRARRIRVAGTNERHPAVDVFSYLGLMAVRLLLDAGIPPYRSRVLVLCDNPFSSYLAEGLTGIGAEVMSATGLTKPWPMGEWAPDVVLVAMTPRAEPVLGVDDVTTLAAQWPGVPVVQFWGDVERAALASAGLPVWPVEAPARGHMAVLPSALGPDPVVRLQAGGLKVAEVLLRDPAARTTEDREFLDELDDVR